MHQELHWMHGMQQRIRQAEVSIYMDHKLTDAGQLL